MRRPNATVAATAIITILILATTITATATAASTVLPEFSPSTGGTLTGGKGNFFFEGTTLGCEKSAGTFGAGAKLGTFTISFKECKAGGKECKSLSGTAGTITINGTWHLVSLLSARKHYLLWLLYGPSANTEATHIECEAAAIGLLLLWGNLLTLITGAKKSYSLNIKRISTNKQELEEFGNNSGQTVKATSLKGKLGTGAERLVTEESTENNLTMTNETTILES